MKSSVPPQIPSSPPPGAVGVCDTAPQARQVRLLVFTHRTIGSDGGPSGFRQKSWDEVQKLNTDAQLHVALKYYYIII